MSNGDPGKKSAAGAPPQDRLPEESPDRGDFETQYHVSSRRRYLSRGEIAVVAVILTLALALRVLFTSQIQTSGFHKLIELRPGTDSVNYDHLARWVLGHGWFEKTIDVSPLYPYVFLPLAYLVTAGSILWVKLLQGALDTGTVLLVYLMARRLYGVRAAIFAGLGAAVYAPFIVYQGQVLGESLLNFLVAAFFVTLLGAQDDVKPLRAAAAGALLALAAAAKPTAVVFAPVAILWMWGRMGAGGRGGWRRAGTILIAAAAFAATLAPLAYRNYRASGELVLVRGNSGIMLYMGNNPSATGAYLNPSDAQGRALDAETRDMPLDLKDRTYRDAAIRFIRDNPKQAIGLLWRKFALFWGAPEIPNNLSVRLYRQTTFLVSWVFLSFGCMLPFAAAGFALSLTSKGARMIAAQIALYSLAIIAFVVVDRYRLAVVPLLLPAAGYAASELVLSFKSLAIGRTAAIAFIAAVAAVPVNWLDITTTADQWLHPGGLEDHIGNKIVIHDDGDYGTRFSAALFNQDSSIAKFIIVQRPLAGLVGANVAAQMAALTPGKLTVTLNDVKTETPMTKSPKRWVVFHFPAEAVEQGTNVVTISSDGLCRAVVYADDVYNFGRSLYRPTGKESITDNLDQVSYSYNPALHMGGHEFKIRLELDFEETAAPATSAAPAPPAKAALSTEGN